MMLWPLHEPSSTRNIERRASEREAFLSSCSCVGSRPAAAVMAETTTATTTVEAALVPAWGPVSRMVNLCVCSSYTKEARKDRAYGLARRCLLRKKIILQSFLAMQNSCYGKMAWQNETRHERYLTAAKEGDEMAIRFCY